MAGQKNFCIPDIILDLLGEGMLFKKYILISLFMLVYKNPQWKMPHLLTSIIDDKLYYLTIDLLGNLNVLYYLILIKQYQIDNVYILRA